MLTVVIKDESGRLHTLPMMVGGCVLFCGAKLEMCAVCVCVCVCVCMCVCVWGGVNEWAAGHSAHDGV